jgi:hypothetical protein
LNLNNPEVEDNLQKLADIYGAGHLKTLSDRDLYILYKKHAARTA